ncbi:hypothetical protein CASFOL_017029 [Castilleja foliolosa]|uniref:AP2/ERF domain-containing protein n=1 Tax=Castilleja foliolosa TaxID=1961234 RepID=A0ABD3DE87_9LAMI
MLKSEASFGPGEGKKVRKPAQASSRKGCMRGKGGPENAACTYKGVRQRTWGKWVAEIREPNRGSRVWLGTFDTSYDAAVAYDASARRLYGPDAKVNLPHLYDQKPKPAQVKIEAQQIINKNPVAISPAPPPPVVYRGEYVSASGILEKLDVSLPEVDDSYLWAQAAKETSFQIVHEPEAFASSLDIGKDSNGVPLYY